MNEEVIIRMGIDGGAVATGLRKVSTSVKEWAGGVKSSINDAFKMLAAPLTGAGMLATLMKTAETVKRIKAESEAKGVSTDFFKTSRMWARRLASPEKR